MLFDDGIKNLIVTGAFHGWLSLNKQKKTSKTVSKRKSTKCQHKKYKTFSSWFRYYNYI